MILLIENSIRRGKSSVKGNGYVISDEIKKISCVDANSLYGHSMSQLLPYDESEMWYGYPDLYMNKLEEILNTPDDSEIGFSVDVDFKNLDIKSNQRRKTFHFVLRKN